MKQYVVSLLVFLFLLALQPLYAEAGHSARAGFTSRSFVVRAGPGHFVSPSVDIVNPGRARSVRVSSFARKVVILPRHHIVVSHHHFVENTVIIREPFFGFDHLHRFHGLAFETIPGVIVHNGPQVFFFGD